MFAEYITVQGDFWTTIAQKAYGDPFLVGRIVEANPTIDLALTLEGGLRIAIPIPDGEEEEPIDTDLLPPWKR